LRLLDDILKNILTEVSWCVICFDGKGEICRSVSKGR